MPEVRLSPRSRTILESSLSVAAARVVTVLCSFVAMPMCLGYLGLPAFGLWATITSVVAVMAFADLGIGNGVLNMLSTAYGRNDAAAICRTIATALVLLSSLGSLVFVLFLGLHGFVSWDVVLGAGGVVPAATVAAAVTILAITVALNLPTTLFQRMQFALQFGRLNGLTQAGGGILALLFIYFVTKTSWGLPGMVAATLAAPLIATWLSAAWMFSRLPAIRPTVADFNTKDVGPILKSGGQFLILGIVFSLCQTSDSLIIANVLGASAVASFAVHQKYVSPIAFVAGMALTPLWAAYAEALARGDIAWIKQAFKKSVLYLVSLAIVLSVVLILLLDPLMAIWMKGRVAPDKLMAGALLIWLTVELLGKSISIFLHGMGMVGQQVWTAVVFLPVCLGAKVIFGQHFGAPGVMVGTALAYVLVHAWPYWRLVRRWHLENVDAAVVKPSQAPGI